MKQQLKSRLPARKGQGPVTTIADRRASPPVLRMIALAFGVLLATFALVSQGFAQSRLVIETGKGVILENTEMAEAIFVADPMIADVRSSPGDAHFLYGRSLGETTLVATALDGTKLFEHTVFVIPNLAEVNEAMASRFPDTPVKVHVSRGSILVSGSVPDLLTRDSIMATLDRSLPDNLVLDRLEVAGGTAIQLDVKIIELSSENLERFGVNWSALLGAGQARQSGQSAASRRTSQIQNTLNLLFDKGVATLHSETTLATLADKTANFKSGSEIAIPRFGKDADGTDGHFGVDYKFVGMEMDFTPRAVAGDKVNLAISSVVSNLSASASSINGNSFPVLNSRRFATQIELENGETFVIAGLSRHDTNATLQKPRNPSSPGLQRSLLGRDEIARRNQELLVVVTPHFGANRNAQASIDHLPRLSSNLEFILSQKLDADKRNPSRIRIAGPSGFLY